MRFAACAVLVFILVASVFVAVVELIRLCRGQDDEQQ